MMTKTTKTRKMPRKKMKKYISVINLYVWEKYAIFIFYNQTQQRKKESG